MEKNDPINRAPCNTKGEMTNAERGLEVRPHRITSSLTQDASSKHFQVAFRKARKVLEI